MHNIEVDTAQIVFHVLVNILEISTSLPTDLTIQLFNQSMSWLNSGELLYIDWMHSKKASLKGKHY